MCRINTNTIHTLCDAYYVSYIYIYVCVHAMYCLMSYVHMYYVYTLCTTSVSSAKGRTFSSNDWLFCSPLTFRVSEWRWLRMPWMSQTDCVTCCDISHTSPNRWCYATSTRSQCGRLLVTHRETMTARLYDGWPHNVVMEVNKCGRVGGSPLYPQVWGKHTYRTASSM